MMGARPKVALINPPSLRPVLRDYYCSTFPKARYHWHPIDLLAVGARLTGRADARIWDAVATADKPAKTLEAVAAFAPDSAMVLVSALTRASDLAFIARLRASVPSLRRVMISGEVAQDRQWSFDSASGSAGGVDALSLDFTAPEAADYLLGDAPYGRLRTADHVPGAPVQRGVYALGAVMPHQGLPGAGTHSRYRLPLTRGPYYSLLTDFGCPWACTFCNSGRHVLGYQTRDLDEVRAEVAAIAGLGGRTVYLRDMTFGANRGHAEAVLAALTKHRIASRGFLRADIVDQGFARALGRAGFRLAQIGVETPTEGRRRTMGKKLGDARLVEAFRLLAEHGVAAGAHFVVGMAGEPPDVVGQCVALARKLQAAYVSINLYEHRHGCEVQAPASPTARAKLQVAAPVAMARYNASAVARQGISRWSRLVPRRAAKGAGLASYIDRERERV